MNNNYNPPFPQQPQQPQQGGYYQQQHTQQQGGGYAMHPSMSMPMPGAGMPMNGTPLPPYGQHQQQQHHVPLQHSMSAPAPAPYAPAAPAPATMIKATPQPVFDARFCAPNGEPTELVATEQFGFMTDDDFKMTDRYGRVWFQ